MSREQRLEAALNDAKHTLLLFADQEHAHVERAPSGRCDYCGMLWPCDAEDARREVVRIVAALGEQNTFCEKCNTDSHRCGGCGIPLPHGVAVCAACLGEQEAAPSKIEQELNYWRAKAAEYAYIIEQESISMEELAESLGLGEQEATPPEPTDGCGIHGADATYVTAMESYCTCAPQGEAEPKRDAMDTTDWTRFRCHCGFAVSGAREYEMEWIAQEHRSLMHGDGDDD